MVSSASYAPHVIVAPGQLADLRILPLLLRLAAARLSKVPVSIAFCYCLAPVPI